MEDESLEAKLAANLAAIRETIAASCRRAGRDPGKVDLLPATKYADVRIMRALMALGLRDFGENQVKQAEEKAAALGGDAVFHMIGHLQRNKVKRAVRLFRSIQSVDSIRLAEEIARRVGDRTIPALIEVNVAGEAQKYGFSPEELFPALEAISRLQGLRVEGLMTVPPYMENPEKVRPYFRSLCEITDEARRRGLGDGKLETISMGMSNDFPVAVEEGATVVRVGSTLFAGL